MSFTIDFDNTEVGNFISNIISNETMRTIAPDISIAFLRLHNTLTTQVQKNYKVPFSLDSVFTGVKNTSDGFSISYTNKSISLGLYPHKETEVTVKNSIPFGFSNGFVRYTPVNKAVKTVVTIRRAGGRTLPRQRTKYSKFFNPNTGKIYVRLQDATWSKIPSTYDIKGKRASYKELFGPSLSTLASIVYDFDPQMEVARDTLSSETLDAVLKHSKSK
jgi:hypothetical protein